MYYMKVLTTKKLLHPSEPEEGEINSVTVNVSSGNLKVSEAVVDKEIGSVSVDGGTEPYSYELTGTDADKFKIEETKVKIKENLTEPKTYTAKVKATDKNKKTKESAEFSIEVSADDPEITSITVTPEQELTDPVESDAKVASLSAEGGTPDYTYSLAGGTDDEKFKIEGAEVKANEQLHENTYTIKVKVTDSKSKEKVSDDVTINVTASLSDDVNDDGPQIFDESSSKKSKK